jgi:hypothetical protein
LKSSDHPCTLANTCSDQPKKTGVRGGAHGRVESH